MITYLSDVTKESVIDIYAKVTKPNQDIISCTKKQELSILKFFVVNRACQILPFQIEDASRPTERDEMEDYEEKKVEIKKEDIKEEEKEKQVKVLLKTKLDNRVLDLRTPAKQAIFRLSSNVCLLFREFLVSKGFMEIHTPKLISGTSEGGSNVFKLKYFDKDCCLAQSPQLYKQMCVLADFERVFEIGPVFRAENSFTHRHMCEFIGLDVEMTIKEHYMEVLEVLGDLFFFMFSEIEKRFGFLLTEINKQFPFEPFKCKYPILKLTYEEGIKLLHENNVPQSIMEDLTTETEKKLGDIVRKKYDTDFYMLHRYPKTARPFYTMLCKDNPIFTNSYDFFIRGEEIVSGAQRIHDPELLSKRAQECNINISTLKDYIDSFKYGAFPHGGCGVGLERVVMLYCNLGNIRHTSLFPRDPKRLAP